MTRFLLKESAALTAEPWQDAQGNVHLRLRNREGSGNAVACASGRKRAPNYPGRTQVLISAGGAGASQDE